MLRKNLITLIGISALTMGVQPVFADILGSGGTHVNQGLLGSTYKILTTNLSGTPGIPFSTTASVTKIWVSVTASCFIAFGSTADFVDIDVLIDGISIGPSGDDAPFCSSTLTLSGPSYPAQNGVMAAGNFVGGVAAGTHQVIVRAKVRNVNGSGSTPTSQASIRGLSVVVSK